LLEPEIEKLVRKSIRRGSVLVQVRVARTTAIEESAINTQALAGYLRQLKQACQLAEAPELLAPLVSGLLAMPGVAPESIASSSVPETEWPQVERTLIAALRKLDEVRKTEGRVMAEELLGYHRKLTEDLNSVSQHLPRIMTDYRQRILERVRQAVAETQVKVEPDHLIREIAAFADRTDVAEEVTRLAAHLDQFAELVKTGAEGAGRRLEFVMQEMVRETNTMGSKAGDVTVSRLVVEIKATLEKIRELIQNVE
jgi:uncharacterized protein (TIGR00255 family)